MTEKLKALPQGASGSYTQLQLRNAHIPLSQLIANDQQSVTNRWQTKQNTTEHNSAMSYEVYVR